MGGRGSSSGLGRVTQANISSLSDQELKTYTTKAFRDLNKTERENKDLRKERFEIYEKLKSHKSWAKRNPKYDNDLLKKRKEKAKQIDEKLNKLDPKLKRAEKKYRRASKEWEKRFPNKSFLD